MKALNKDTVREIKKSRNRFLSIVAIIALGICFFAGVKSTGPSMKYTANQYYQEQRLMDIRLVSTFGFQDNDVEAIKKSPSVNAVMPGYSADVIIEKGDKRPVLKLMSAPPADGLNQPVLLEGRNPENPGEILLEQPQANESAVSEAFDYKLGDIIKLSSEIGDAPLSDSMNRDSFTIVGFVRSPQYVSIERGSTSIGSGEVAYYGFADSSAFAFERFTEVYVLSQASANGVNAFTSEYQEAIRALEIEMEDLGAERLEINYNDIINSARAELDKGKKELADAGQQLDQGIKQGEASLAAARAELSAGEIELANGQAEYDRTIAATEAQLTDAQNRIDQGEIDLARGAVTLQEELSRGEDQLAQARLGIAQLQDAIAQMEAQDPSGQLPALEAALEDTQNQVDQIQNQLNLLLAAQAVIEEQINSLDPTAPDYEIQLGILNQMLAVLSGQIENATEALSIAEAGLAEIQNAINEIYAFQAILAGMKEQLAQAETALAAGEQALSAAAVQGQQKLDQGRADLEKARVDLANGITAFEAGKIQGRNELAAARNELDAGWVALADGETQLADKKAAGEAEISKGTQRLAEAEAEISTIDFGKWYVFNREDNPGYTSYGEDAQRIDNMSGIFPMFFLLVAALVSFTTMTRMVEEQRTQIGTLKALGYSHTQIASKFFIYALSAALTGIIIGLTIGLNTLPYMIAGAYNLLYQMPELSLYVPWLPIGISCMIAVLCTVTAAIAVSAIELREQPSELMRPKAPKIGKRIFLEKIPLIWKRMGFIEKVTARNLLRYKGRFFMTVIGIAGCTALILAGFGLQDAIFSIIPRQFENVSVYDGVFSFKTEGSLAEKAETKAALDGDSRFSENMMVYQTKMTIEKQDGGIAKEAFLVVPESSKSIRDFIHLQNRKTGEPIDLAEAGVVISEKAASDLGLKVGDTIRVYSDDESQELTLGAITENYLENFLYLSPEVYEEAFGGPLKVNTAYVNIPEQSQESQNEIARDWLDNTGVVAINFTSNIVSTTNNSLGSLNIVVLVMILSAGALAVVVLYNLTNINISERIREIATIRVLGFYDMEIYKYIFRENLVLSVFGIAVGLILGIILNGYIINTVETDIVMFGRGIEATSFLYAILFTMGFTFLVNLLMTPMIKKISMVESLKSVE